MTETLKPKSGWRWPRRILITLAVLATLIAIFYTEEDWRGKHAWENYKQEAEAQGQFLDWNRFIPQPVPDDQNFYTFSTNFLEFKQVQTDAEAEAVKKISWLDLSPFRTNNNGRPFPLLDTSKAKPIVITKITISSQTTGLLPGSNTFVVLLNDSDAATRIRQSILSIIGPTIQGVQGFDFSVHQSANLPLVQIFLQASTPPSVEALDAFCPSNAVGLKVVATTDQNTFDILLTDTRIMTAAEYLNWSDQFVPAFADIREALRRPYAFLPGDYSKPYLQPIPNFVLMRLLAQTLGQRAQCYFLLGEPDKALDELTLVHDVCRILQKPPTGQPETLVEAMINVAIHGLYVGVVEQGFQRHAWQEPQLVLLQAQLGRINLFSPAVNAFSSERAATARVMETTPSMAFRVLQGSKWVFWPLLKSALVPRGWIYQNMVTEDKTLHEGLESYDATNEIFHPGIIKSAYSQAQPDPYNFVALRYLPNFTKAWQVTAYTQTMINEAQIACALERYHVVRGGYPEALDALVPQYMQTIPHDLIGGQPLHYRRTDNGKFLLYSVGWNETDDGGQPSPHNAIGGVADYGQGDWVWPN